MSTRIEIRVEPVAVPSDREALIADLRGTHVETYSFRSPGFYQSNGYTVFGRLDGFTGGHAKFYLQKSLGGSREAMA